MPRYVTASCCSDLRHVQNRTDPYYLEDMLLALDGVKLHMKEHQQAAGKKNFRIFNPFQEVRNWENSEIWEPDPVHTSVATLEKWQTG
jgi:hypothetical protein